VFCVKGLIPSSKRNGHVGRQGGALCGLSRLYQVVKIVLVLTPHLDQKCSFTHH
jgi:hypothetical protein